MRGAGPAEATTCTVVPLVTVAPAVNVGAAGTDHDTTIPTGTISSYTASDSMSTRPSSVSVAVASATVRPASSGSARGAGTGADEDVELLAVLQRGAGRRARCE